MSNRRRRHPRTPTALLLQAAVLVVLLTFGASSAQAAPRDPVVIAINKARVDRELTYPQFRQIRRDWALSARAQRTARTASRRAAIQSVRLATIRMAQRGQLTAQRVEPALLSVRATTWVMLRGSYPRHEEEVTIPGEVLVFTYYSGRGVQFQPFETFKQGLRELNQAEPDTEAARAIADRMLGLSVRRGTSITWEYYFPFGGPSTPWTSAISQAIATEFLQRVGESVDESEREQYATAAEEVARSFLRSTRVGGVGVSQGDGRYYVMYSFNPWQRILNGHLQALINLNRYASASGSRAAQRAVDHGVAAVLPMLPRFDTGAWSNYQPGQEAELDYHEFQAGQLVKLGDETGNATLAEYGARFTTYLETPPTVTFPTPLYPAIFPADDDFRDSIAVPVVVDKRSKVTLVVSDSDGNEMGRASTTTGRGRTSVTWDGTGPDGARAPAGTYSGRITATDVAGNRGHVELEAPLRVIADETPPTMRVLTTREHRGMTIVTVNAFDMASATITARIRVGGRIIAFARGGRAGTIVLRTKRPLALVQRGQLLLRDTSGNELTYELSS